MARTSSTDAAGRLGADERRVLLGLARESIRGGLVGRRPEVDLDALTPALRAPAATFVTLKLEERLRGCIGTLEPHRPLAVDVAQNAYNAAYHDPRFAPLLDEEFALLDIHISILGRPQPLRFTSEADLLAQLRPGVDGVIVHALGQRATFLPSVWDTVADAREFWRQLKCKAGLPADYWSDAMRVSRYTVESIP